MGASDAYGTVNLHPQEGGGIFDRRNAEFSTGVDTMRQSSSQLCPVSNEWP
jgi:hypothetical protein